MESLAWRLGASRPVGYMVELVGWVTLQGLGVAGGFLMRLLPDDTMHPAEYVAYRENPDDPWERTKLISLHGGPPLT